MQSLQYLRSIFLPNLYFLQLQIVMMEYRINVKLASTAVELVQNVQLVMMKFKIKGKMILTVEDHVKRVQLVTMVLRIKGKQALIAEAHVIHTAKVLRTCAMIHVSSEDFIIQLISVI